MEGGQGALAINPNYRGGAEAEVRAENEESFLESLFCFVFDYHSLSEAGEVVSYD